MCQTDGLHCDIFSMILQWARFYICCQGNCTLTTTSLPHSSSVKVPRWKPQSIDYWAIFSSHCFFASFLLLIWKCIDIKHLYHDIWLFKNGTTETSYSQYIYITIPTVRMLKSDWIICCEVIPHGNVILSFHIWIQSFFGGTI